MELEVEMLANIRGALEAHSAECCQIPKAILLNPGNHALIGWDEVFGLPVLPDERVSPKRCRLMCGDHGWGGLFETKRVWWKADGSPHHLDQEEEADVKRGSLAS